MDIANIKQFAKNEKELESLLQAVKIYSQEIGTEYVQEKGAMLIIKSEKQQLSEAIELPNQEKIRTLGQKETCKNLAILEADTVKNAQMKEKK